MALARIFQHCLRIATIDPTTAINYRIYETQFKIGFAAPHQVLLALFSIQLCIHKHTYTPLYYKAIDCASFG